MAERIKLQAIIYTEDALRMVNQALVDILIAKQIISEGELIAAIGKIRKQQENSFDGTIQLFK